jgi:hypothetical protein
MCSGLHRKQWLAEALRSIPWDAPQLSQVNIVHQGEVWNWADDLRSEVERQPKAKIIEFPEPLELAASLNRGVSTVATEWFVMLADDDYLLTAAFAAALEQFETLRRQPIGLIAYGWYYLKQQAGYFMADRVRSCSPAGALRYTPPLCATFIRKSAFQTCNGFDSTNGGFMDTLLFARMIRREGALFSASPIGVFRIHQQQISADRAKLYGPYAAACRKQLLRYATTSGDAAAFDRQMKRFLNNKSSLAGRVRTWLLKRKAPRVPVNLELPRALPSRRCSERLNKAVPVSD